MITHLHVLSLSSASSNLHGTGSDVNKAISIKAKALIPKAKAKDYQFVSRPGQGQVFARARQTTPSVT